MVIYHEEKQSFNYKSVNLRISNLIEWRVEENVITVLKKFPWIFPLLKKNNQKVQIKITKLFNICNRKEFLIVLNNPEKVKLK